jgi:hypothetical protein
MFALWTIWSGLIAAVVFIGMVLGVATNRHEALARNRLPSVPLVAVVLLIVGIGVACALIAKAVDRPLDASSTGSLRSSYFRRFFLRVGLGEVPFFLGITALAVTGHFWLYFVGVAFDAIALFSLAPTSHNLNRVQREIDSRGGQLSIREALETLPSRSRRSSWN